MKVKAIKGLGLPPKKHSFKVNSLTFLLCAHWIDKCLNYGLFNRLAYKIRFEPLSVDHECIGRLTARFHFNI